MIETRVQGACGNRAGSVSRACTGWKTAALVALAGGGSGGSLILSTVLICPALPLHYPANLHNAGPAVTQLQHAWFNISMCVHVCVGVIISYRDETLGHCGIRERCDLRRCTRVFM